jgi:hypothetical protein
MSSKWKLLFSTIQMDLGLWTEKHLMRFFNVSFLINPL